MVEQRNRKGWRDIARRMTLPKGLASALEQPPLSRFGNWACYGFAIGAVAVAMVATYTIPPLREQPPNLLFFVAVVLTSWYAGLRAGLIAAVLSIVALDLFFLGKPIFSLRMEIVEDGVDLVAFAAATWLVSLFQDRWRQTHHKLVAVEQEMQIARRIQQRFFPATALSPAGFEIAGTCLPAADTGGDFFDYIPMLDERLGITLGDVSGHGLGPAIVMVLVRAYLRALALTYSAPEEILTKANRLVYEDVEEGWFATVAFLQLDTRSGSLLYAGAGHESYLLDASGEVTRLESTGLPLGLFADATIGQRPLAALRPGEIMVLLSDGIVENRSIWREPFGLERALESVRAHRQESSPEIVAALFQAVRSYLGNAAQKDDMTIVVVKAI